MKNMSKLYLFFTSLFFLFSPFSLGLENIYIEAENISDWSGGMFFNIGLIIILLSVMGTLYYKKILDLPNKEEIKYLIFGFLSNIVIYFYVFQESLDIEKFMTIYFTIIIILLLYMLIMDYKKLNYELWILAVLFFIIDFVHYEYIYNDWNHLLNEVQNQANNVDANFFIRLFYYLAPFTALSLFIIKIRSYKIIDAFAVIAIVIVVLLLSIYVGVDTESKFILTLMLLLPFVIIADFIISKIYKRFNLLKIPFYIRILIIISLLFIYQVESYFIMDSYSDHSLYELIFIIYAAAVCNLLEFLVPQNPNIFIDE